MTEVPETRYATTEDGVSIAYQAVGDRPVNLVLDLESWGNVDTMWELPQLADLFGRLSAFSRLILHDRRGTGLSGGGSSFPNLETRARDLLTVLDTIRSPRVALFGERTAGAALAMFAATYPDRISSLLWFDPVATRRWSPEYPWGRTPAEIRREAEWTRDLIGDKSLVHEWLKGMAPSLAGDERLEAQLTRLDRHFMAPSTAVDWINVESEVDVTAVLPTLRCPTLLIDHQRSPTGAAESRHVQTIIRGAELVLIPGDPNGMVFSDQAAIADAIGGFLVSDSKAVASDTVLGSVLFTDIVGSTERQAAMGDRAWLELVRGHHAIVRDALERWRGVENDTAGDGFYATFDGPARAVRCALDVVHQVSEMGIEIRAGVHTGECEVIEGKHAGLAVTIGSRIAAKAGPSEVLVSRTVKDLTAGSWFSFDDIGEHELKGVPDRWHLYRVTA
ncbi:MAG: Adenylyl cyclase [Thermoleophilia bacterium]|nr:Adenylyl cyclase [Thermoleophilia bacterium]